MSFACCQSHFEAPPPSPDPEALERIRALAIFFSAGVSQVTIEEIRAADQLKTSRVRSARLFERTFVGSSQEEPEDDTEDDSASSQEEVDSLSDESEIASV